ncbi:MAG: ATP-dependent Clp protease proteolytic subunit [Bacteroidetes bacterium]|nr:ATP-dependent Clp protease proteolytic subunit [Bacteroidota bacterium]
MAKKIIVVDGYIGSYAFSKQFIRNELEGHSKNPVQVKISSLGGSVDHALNIYDQFVEHGNVTAELSAFVASSATIISLGAKTVRMNENSFYLIHKAMNWVDEWGTMNEDEIENLIAKLEKQKQELAKVTLQLAKMYVAKSGKALDKIIGLMKQETWLTAEEALDWGFVDEVFIPDVAENYLENMPLVAMVTSNGFPDPPRKNKSQATQPSQSKQSGQQTGLDEESLFERIWNKIVKKQTDDNPISKPVSGPPVNSNINSKIKTNNKPQKISSMKQFGKINAVLGVDALESVDESVSLNSEQLELMEGALSQAEQVATARDTSEAERDTAQTNLTNAVAAYDAIDQTIAAAETTDAKVAAIRALLAAKPGSEIHGNLDKKDPAGNTTNGVDWDTINNLPHNKTVDKNS